jgi:hypothetical protein
LCAALAGSELYRYELAARLRRDPSTLSQWLNGRKPVPVEIGEQILRECTKATRKARCSVRHPKSSGDGSRRFDGRAEPPKLGDC